MLTGAVVLARDYSITNPVVIMNTSNYRGNYMSALCLFYKTV